LPDLDTAEKAKLVNGTVMLVINKKIGKPKKSNESETNNRVPETLSTGMGGSSPVGYGAYSLINHP
jgi:hypothetical protein